MADVFLAVVEGPAGSGFAKLAVVKQLRAHLAEDPEFIAMLMDEARLSARLAHPNVVQLFECAEEAGQYFLAMEFLEGQPLHRVLRRAARERERLGDTRKLFYAVVSDVLAGLHHAHELADYDGRPLEIVHRDVTPHNVFVTYDGAVKVVDFGIAKATGRLTETRQGTIKGKVRYMSPEQAAGGAIDRRADVFAAGVILWNAATGGRFWRDLEDFAIVSALIEGAYEPSPRAVCPDVPPAIDAICRRALAFSPEDRYATAEEMRLDIDAFLGGRSGSLRGELARTVRTLFAKDRARLKSVLAAAGLKTQASVGAFAGKTTATEVAPLAAALPGERARRGPGGTLIMPHAREQQREKPSVAPVEIASSRPRRPRRGRTLIGAALGGVALGAAVLALVAATGRASDPSAASGASPRAVTIVADDRLSLDPEPRPRAVSGDAVGATIGGSRRTPNSRGDGAQATPEPSTGPAPATTTSPSPGSAPAPRSGAPSGTAPLLRRGPIDSTDPWSR